MEPHPHTITVYLNSCFGSCAFVALLFVMYSRRLGGNLGAPPSLSLALHQSNPDLNICQEDFLKHCGKWRKMLVNSIFSFFSAMFFPFFQVQVLTYLPHSKCFACISFFFSDESTMRFCGIELIDSTGLKMAHYDIWCTLSRNWIKISMKVPAVWSSFCL